MEQLELLGLMIREESGIAPVDTTVRADLVDLMARILVAVFQAEGGKGDGRASLQSQDQAGACGAQAIVYLRQSSEKQVRYNLESQRLQYEVADRIRTLGWRQVEIIDSDLGSSAGMAAARREGLERVLSWVTPAEDGRASAAMSTYHRRRSPLSNRGRGGARNERAAFLVNLTPNSPTSALSVIRFEIAEVSFPGWLELPLVTCSCCS